MIAYESLEKALDPARLKGLANKTKGTGGPAIPLPDGSSVTRDVIAAALEAVLASGTVGCRQLVLALGDERVHIRYGAWMALQRVTGDKEPYFYPFQAPDSPRNVEAIEAWKERCDRSGSEDQEPGT